MDVLSQIEHILGALVPVLLVMGWWIRSQNVKLDAIQESHKAEHVALDKKLGHTHDHGKGDHDELKEALRESMRCVEQLKSEMNAKLDTHKDDHKSEHQTLVGASERMENIINKMREDQIKGPYKKECKKCGQ